LAISAAGEVATAMGWSLSYTLGVPAQDGTGLLQGHIVS
jgi:hypothetical protein